MRLHGFERGVPIVLDFEPQISTTTGTITMLMSVSRISNSVTPKRLFHRIWPEIPRGEGAGVGIGSADVVPH